MKKSILDFDIKNKVVILRCDLNVSIKDNKIIDDTRIKSSLKTINYLLDNNAKVVILSHLGKVKTEEDKTKNSLKTVYERLNELVPNKIIFVPYTRDDKIKEELNNIDYGKAILLENTRYEDIDGKKESLNDDELAKYWASLGDLFINDAFGTLHRAHASNLGISSHLETGTGFLVEKELKELDKLDNPEKPFAVIMGGSKISDKLGVIFSLIDKVDYLLIGGAMAFTFLKAQEFEIGKSLYEEEQLDYCKDLLTKYPNKILLPIDFYASTEFSNETEKLLVNINSFKNDFMGLDIGIETIDLFKNKLKGVKTLFWNGPLGAYELSKYQEGTKKILEYISNNIETTILGGGDIVACAEKLGYTNKVTFVSTGGGASLEYLTNKNLPGLERIKNK